LFGSKALFGDLRRFGVLGAYFLVGRLKSVVWGNMKLRRAFKTQRGSGQDVLSGSRQAEPERQDQIF
jgi:hypothetical protein